MFGIKELTTKTVNAKLKIGLNGHAFLEGQFLSVPELQPSLRFDQARNIHQS